MYLYIGGHRGPLGVEDIEMSAEYKKEPTMGRLEERERQGQGQVKIGKTKRGV